MRHDVLELSRFYVSPLGRAAQAMMARRVRAAWPDVTGLDVLGLGYATPMLDALEGNPRRRVAAMPAGQGAQIWPSGGKVASGLVDEARMPFRESLFDRIILAHVLEEADGLRAVLREVWRVTAPEGRVMVIASNRAGLWCRSPVNPFGHGRPFTRTQLSDTLRDAMFEPVAFARAIYMPPTLWGPVIRSAEAWERAGERLWSRHGGVVLVEAIKRIEAHRPRGGTPARVAPVVRPAGFRA